MELVNYHSRFTNLCPELNVARGILLMGIENGPVTGSCYML
jgi:hypothetical protein